MKTINKKLMLPIAVAVIITSMGFATFASSGKAEAATQSPTMMKGKGHKGSFGKMPKPTAIGTVASINGNTITLTGKNGTTYTIDATNTKITKAPEIPTTKPTKGTPRPSPTTITITDIKVGDNLIVKGTLTGTSIVATDILDGKGMMGGRMMKDDEKNETTKDNEDTEASRVSGNVIAVNGNTITIKENRKTNPQTYTVDVTDAKIATAGTKGQAPTPTTVSSITVGDNIMIKGTITGTSVKAIDVIRGITMGSHRSKMHSTN